MLEHEDYKKHRAGTAAVLSFILNGLGQIYLGHIKKGLMIIFWSLLFLLIVGVGLTLIIYQSMINNLGSSIFMQGIIITAIGLVASGIISIYNIFDAYNRGLKS